MVFDGAVIDASAVCVSVAPRADFGIVHCQHQTLLVSVGGWQGDILLFVTNFSNICPSPLIRDHPNCGVHGFRLSCQKFLLTPVFIVRDRHSHSELRSDITGKVVRFLQEDGAEVNAGEPYVEVREAPSRRMTDVLGLASLTY